jgi:hypothetical protein
MRKGVMLGVVALAIAALQPQATAATTGTIKGRVLDGSSDKPLAGVQVTLTSGTSQGETESETVTTDRQGRYRFDDLTTGDDLFYALDARYKGGLFPGSAITLPDDTDEKPVIDTTLKVWDTIDDPASIVIERNDVFVIESEDGKVGVLEAFQITNVSDKAYIGRGASMETSGDATVPSLGFALPSGAEQEQLQIYESSLDIPELLRTDFGFGITTAIPPGNFTITYTYDLPGTAASYDLSRRVLYPTLNFAVFTSEKLVVTSNRLESQGSVEIRDRVYEQFSTEDDLEAGASVQVVALADAGTPPGLIAGMIGVLVLVALLGTIPFLRRRRPKTTETHPSSRDEILREIASLDLARERDEVSEQEWQAARQRLKERLEKGPT